MNTEDKNRLSQSFGSILTHIRKLKKLGDQAEVRLFEFLEGVEPKGDWTAKAKTFETFLGSEVMVSAARFRKWQKGCGMAKKGDRSLIGVNAVVVLSEASPKKADTLLAELRSVAKDAKTTLTMSCARTIKRKLDPKGSKPNKLKEENANLKEEVAVLKKAVAKLTGDCKVCPKLRAQISDLKAEKLELETAISKLRKPKRKRPASRPVAQA